MQSIDLRLRICVSKIQIGTPSAPLQVCLRIGHAMETQSVLTTQEVPHEGVATFNSVVTKYIRSQYDSKTGLLLEKQVVLVVYSITPVRRTQVGEVSIEMGDLATGQNWFQSELQVGEGQGRLCYSIQFQIMEALVRGQYHAGKMGSPKKEKVSPRGSRAELGSRMQTPRSASYGLPSPRPAFAQLEVEPLRKKVSQLLDEKLEITKEMRTTKTHYRENQLKFQQQTEQLAKIKLKIANLDANFRQQTRDLAESRSQLAIQTAQIRELEIKEAEIAANYQSLRMAHKQLITSSESQLQQIKQLESSLKALRRASEEERIERQNSEKKHLAREESSQSFVNHLQQTLAGLQQEKYRLLTSRNEAFQALGERERTARAKAKEKEDMMHNEIFALEKKIKALERANSEPSPTPSPSNHPDLASLQKELQDSKQQLKSSCEENKWLGQQIGILQASLQNRIAQQEDSASHHQITLDSLTKKNMEIVSLKSTLEEHSKNESVFKDKICVLEGELRRAQSQSKQTKKGGQDIQGPASAALHQSCLQIIGQLKQKLAQTQDRLQKMSQMALKWKIAENALESKEVTIKQMMGVQKQQEGVINGLQEKLKCLQASTANVWWREKGITQKQYEGVMAELVLKQEQIVSLRSQVDLLMSKKETPARHVKVGK